MTTQLELVYILKKHEKEDLFESDLFVKIPIPGNQGQIRFLDQVALNAEAAGANALMGVRIQNAPQRKILLFSRRSPVANLEFPDDSQIQVKLTKLRFRVLTTMVDNNGVEKNFAISYDILKKNVKEENVLTGNGWRALLTFANGNFNLLHLREGGPGGGNPCRELGCANADDWALKIKCILTGCSI